MSERQSLLEKVMDEGTRRGCLRVDAERNLARYGAGYFPQRCAVTAGVLKKFEGLGLNLPEAARRPYPYYRFYQMLLDADPQVLEAADFRNVLPPPEGIHLIGMGKRILLDTQNADMIEEAAHDAGFSMESGRILDFGCSSGRTVRSFWEAFPNADWHGVDPIQKTVDWARKTFPEITFHCNDTDPPMNFFTDDQFDAVYAKSIWTHFSHQASVNWMNEMHRILKPGGLLMFTVWGYHRLAERLAGGEFDWSLKNSSKGPLESYLIDAARSFIERGFHFMPMEHHQFLKNISHWGTTFMRQDWVERELLSGGFVLVDMKPARNGNQDLYLCRNI